ncbi:MAG: Transcriptional regulator ArsR family [Candidatus Methanohalarchaeum thermophilum]|uniref:Transcriptional regulator ArsR family n=1 Tax=Methanohalarchaeum thermophilum TaxID=1903181 RepID=A0A1Q6DSG9_METT1|nr:MAG: Transcriptional regulator ArsR family [Candidatus Methanohalarchaeum thermophilum]
MIEDLGKTKQKILKKLLNQPKTAIQLKKELKINESAIRTHLKDLEQKNYTKHNYKKAKKGRPKKTHQLTKKAKTQFPEKEHILLRLLIQQIQKNHGQKTLKKLLKDASKQLTQEINPKTKNIQQLKQTLKELGFKPRIKENKDHFQIKYRNCIFEKSRPQLEKQLCYFHKTLTQQLLKTKKIELKKTKTGSCIHKIKKPIKR